VSAIPTTTTGMLIKKMLRHPKEPIRTPPREGPIAAAVATIADHRPNIRARRDGSVNWAISSDSELGMNMAAPMPCTARAPMRITGEGATAHPKDAARNTPMPSM